MKKYRKMLVAMAAFVATTVGAVASPVYYTIFHALEEDTMEVFTYGGQGMLKLSTDGGDSYRQISSFRFDRHGRAVAKVYALNHAPKDAMVSWWHHLTEERTDNPLTPLSKPLRVNFSIR